MEIVYNGEDLDLYLRTSAGASPGHPTLIDKFMEDYTEVDVDAVSDGEEVYVGGIMEHVEEAGVHSGDSSCVTPPITHPQGAARRGSKTTPGGWRSPLA